jgi:uncharacterized protein
MRTTAGLATFLAAVLASFIGAHAPAGAAPLRSAAAAANHPAEVAVADSRRVTFVSRVNGHRYAIDIALPDMPPPPKGYPVIYVLDGDFYFASVAEAARVIGNAPQAIVVGIGYPHDPAWVASVFAKHRPLPAIFAAFPPFVAAVELERTYDLTLPLNAAQREDEADRGLPLAAGDVGGVDDFLKTIETDVKPRVFALAPVDRGNQTLFGHSLGGLAVLEALFSEPDAFRTFVAASPSIWWGGGRVLRGEKAFSARVAAGRIAPRLLVTAGGEEESVAGLAPKIADEIRKLRMIGNACDLARRLKSLRGARGYEIADCAVFPRQDHGISVWPAIGRAIGFAFPH